MDRATSRVAFIASTEGGMDIEEVAHKTPEKIHTFQIEPAAGYSPYVGNEIAVALGLKGDQAKQMRRRWSRSIYEAFIAKDMSLLEINPLVVTKDGKIVCLDAKINFDDNALYRHKDIQALRDLDEEDPDGSRSRRNTISPTSSSTARSAAWSTARAWPWRRWTSSSSMASEPANFLDVGGGASQGKSDGGVQDHRVAIRM